jgi:hypothetical protein
MPKLVPAVRVRVLACLCGLCLLSPGLLTAQAPSEAPPRAGGDTIDVELKIVPFYAVDAEGRPVFDLRPDEVELRVGGESVPVSSFDRYTAVGAWSDAGAVPAAPAQPAARNVFLLFDASFSTPKGLITGRKFASGLLERLPATDRLTLLVNDPSIGFKKPVGPVPADEQGKKKVMAGIKEIQPEVRRLNLAAVADMGPPSTGNTAKGQPAHQLNHVYDFTNGSARGEYTNFARELAESLGVFASDLRRIRGPKLLLVFSQGVDQWLYFQGDSGFGVGSSETTRVDTRRQSALVSYFEEPLQALADSGAMFLFINTDKEHVEADAALRHMADSVGGLYLEGPAGEQLEKRVANSTSAYYEAGFQPNRALLDAARAEVEVVVRRPGVKVWAAPSVKTRETYGHLSPQDRRRMVVDLILGGPEAQRARLPVALGLTELAGKATGRVESDRRVLRFEIDWPREAIQQTVDLYTVVLAPPAEGKKPEIIQFDLQEKIPAAAYSAIETELAGEDSYVWGMVAVEPASGRTWYRRLMVDPGKEAK